MDEEQVTPEELAELEQPPPIVPPDIAAPPAVAPAIEPPAVGANGAPAVPDIIDRTIAEPLEAPVSGKMPEDENAFPPPVPAEAPGMVPVAPKPGEKPKAAAPAIPGVEPTAEDVIRREQKQKEAKAAEEEATAQKVAEEQERHRRAQEEALIDAKARQQEAQDELQRRIADFDRDKELRDPRSFQTTGDKWRNALAIAFGAFGAGLSAAGGHPTGNLGMAAVQKRMDDETERQKFKIQRDSDAIVMARAGVRDADEARRLLSLDEDARHASRLNEATAYGIQRLKALGMNDAAIEADSRIVALRQAQAKAHQQAADAAAKNALIAAQAEAAKARAARDVRKAKGGGAGVGKGLAAQRLALAQQKAADQAQEKQDERTVRDTDGNPIGLAPNARSVNALTDKIAAVQSYREKVDALAAHIKQHGRILNPLSDEAKERASLAADVQAAGRQVSGIQASDAGQKLEHEMIGGSGVGIERMANPAVLNELAKRASELVDHKLKATLTPLPKKAEPAPYRATERAALGAPAGGGMITIRNKRTGETKRVTREEAQRMGAL